MTRRRRDVGEGSLELLLDTICNTFGGILFLAMLVSLLLSQTRRRSEADDDDAQPRAALTPAELTRLDTAAKQLAAEVESLERAVRQARAAAADFSVPGLEMELTRLEEAERTRSKLEAERRSTLSELASAQATAARVQGMAAAAEQDLERAKAAETVAQERLEAAIEDRRRLVQSAIALRDAESASAIVETTGRAPRERATTKTEFGVMLKYGRMYLMQVLRNGKLVVNEEEFFIEAGTDRNTAIAKPHAGLELRSAETLRQSLTDRLRSFPAARWYPCLVVHPDSFDAFVVLKAELVARGYEYRLIPTAGSVVDRGGTGAVQ